MNSWKTLGSVLILLITLGQEQAEAEIVYDSIGEVAVGDGIIFGGGSTGPDRPYLWLASLIRLHGTSRRVNSFDFNVHGRDNPVTTSIFGAIFLDEGESRPGSLLWQGTPHDYSLATSALQTVSVDVPFIAVPEEVWVVAGVAFVPGSGSTLRFREYIGEPPTGANLANLYQDGLYQGVAGDWQESRGAWAIRVNAVPEPASFLLGAITLCGCCSYRWFRRRCVVGTDSSLSMNAFQGHLSVTRARGAAGPGP